MEQTDTNEEMPYSEILVTLGDVLDPNIRGEIAMGKRQITGKTYEDQPIPSQDLSKIAENYREQIIDQIEQELREEGQFTLTMFTCPNGNATDMKNKFAEIIPQSFDSNQIFFQRLPLVKKLFKEANNQNLCVTLNLILGDDDFLSYYYPAIKDKISQSDLNFDQYLENVVSYRDSLVGEIRKIFIKENIKADIFDYEKLSVTDTGRTYDKYSTNRSAVNVISLSLNTATGWNTQEIDGEKEVVEGGDVSEEAFYTSRRCNSPRFDPNVFANLSQEAYEKMARIKMNSYRRQGEMVRKIGGRIVLMDELPPALKTRFLNNDNSNLLFLYPWIREGDAWRTRDVVKLEKINRLKEVLK
ncbi:MAG: hypothetical protein AB9915_03935 [Candidatus Dojkabacteria bacterium]